MSLRPRGKDESIENACVLTLSGSILRTLREEISAGAFWIIRWRRQRLREPGKSVKAETGDVGAVAVAKELQGPHFPHLLLVEEALGSDTSGACREGLPEQVMTLVSVDPY